MASARTGKSTENDKRALAAPARWTLAVTVLALAVTSTAHGFSSLFERVSPRAQLAALFPDSEARADVQDGFLIGTGVERMRHLRDGTLQLERTRSYTRIRHPETQAVKPLPEPWTATATLRVTPTLRLISAETRLRFSRSGDTVFPGYKFSEDHEWLFASDRTLLRAIDGGRRLTPSVFSAGKLKKSEQYDYPSDAVPIDLVTLYLSVAVHRHIDQFDFDLLLPGGSVQGVRAQVHRTNVLRRFAKGYRIPPNRLSAREPLAAVDLRLASPVKYIFFPHHFFMVFSAEQPSKLMMMWGGDPDKNLQAFRRD